MRVCFYSSLSKHAQAGFYYRVKLPAKKLNIPIVHDPHQVYDYDIVHMWGFHEGDLYFIIDLVYQGKKVIIDLDDNIFKIPWLSFWNYLEEPEINEVYHLIELAFNTAHAITVTAEALKKVYQDYNKNVYVLPNCICLEDWEKVYSLPRFQHEGILIGYQGSPSHKEDIELVKNVIEDLTKEGITFMVWGVPLDIENIINVGFGSFKNFYSTLWRFNFDLLIAPLRDTDFNRCRSPIKVLEAGMAKTPILVSDVEPYGWLPDRFKVKEDWKTAIKEFLKRDLRKEGEELYNLVIDNFEIGKHIHKWRELYESL